MELNGVFGVVNHRALLERDPYGTGVQVLCLVVFRGDTKFSTRKWG